LRKAECRGATAAFFSCGRAGASLPARKVYFLLRSLFQNFFPATVASAMSPVGVS
jgi:hypothetical protein